MIHITSDEFEPATLLANLHRRNPGLGAVVSFTGIVRDLPNEALEAMVIEHYPGMTERAIAEIVENARRRWQLLDVHVVHRYGKLAPGEVIMMVATAAAHRKEAFDAAEYLMDFLKSRAPFWKKEITASSEKWVEANSADETALGRWTTHHP